MAIMIQILNTIGEYFEYCNLS